jgi:hypothetical protein
MRRTILSSAVVSLVLVATTAGAAVTPTPVIATRLDERYAAASADYIAWQQNSKAHPKHYDVYVQPVGEEGYKVNAAGTEATTGGIDGTTLVYQEWGGKLNNSDVKLFDLTTATSSDPPTGVNTEDWEYWPSISGNWLLFGREFGPGDRSVVLFDLTTEESQTLAGSSGYKRILGPGQVNGSFAVWDRSVVKRGAVVSCEVFVYDIAAGTTTQIPNPNHRCQYAPSVTATGTVYYGRSGMGCGLSARLVSYPPGGPATTLVSLPRGTDFYSSYALTAADGTTSVFYDPTPCGGEADIYEVTVP